MSVRHSSVPSTSRSRVSLGSRQAFGRRPSRWAPISRQAWSSRRNCHGQCRLVRFFLGPRGLLLSLLAALLFVPSATYFSRRGRSLTLEEEPEGQDPESTPVEETKPVALPGASLERNITDPADLDTAAEVEDDLPLECIPNPLWERRVDASTYEYGCDDIKEMLEGDKTLLGNGNIRMVYLVEFRGRMLVLKTLREDFTAKASRTRVEKIHRWEAAALNAVKGHPHIVGLLGNCHSTSVSEFLSTGLEDLVLKKGSEPIPMKRVLSMSLDAARGLQALHEVPGGAIVHFDLKPQQLMLDAHGRLKINDLNMCRFTDADAAGNLCSFVSRASKPGPWRSPENIAGEDLTEKLDVYSLAMVFYSMLAKKPPFEGEPDAKRKILDGIPPLTDPSWDSGYMEIVRDMWRRNPKERPSAREVATRLERLIATREALDQGSAVVARP